jgi:RNA polymerase sigma-70 factor (ECF subfamily)
VFIRGFLRASCVNTGNKHGSSENLSRDLELFFVKDWGGWGVYRRSMATSVTCPPGSSWATRPSLIQRLRAGDDAQGWEEFYRVYGGLIRFVAVKAGLSADEAEEVVQETAIGLARGLPDYVYDPKMCRFKTWLLRLVRWRIQNQFRKRPRGGIGGSGSGASAGAAEDSEGTTGTDPIARLPDPVVPEFGAEWDAAWEKNLLARAMERVRERIEDRQFQVFDMHVTKGWAAGEVARTFGISVARVYLTKHRVAGMLKQEVKRLEKGLGKALSWRVSRDG